MDYKEKLQHYSNASGRNGIKDDDLLDEAIATLEGSFDLMTEDELIYHNRVKAIAYLALKYIKDNK